MATITATWVGAAAYAPPYATLPAWWDTTALVIAPSGILPVGIGAAFVTQQQFVFPGGFISTALGTALATLDWQYIPPYAVVAAQWAADAYTPPSGTVSATWVVAPPAEEQYLFPSSSGFVAAQLGTPDLKNVVEYIAPAGIAAGGLGTAIVQNAALAAFPGGIAPPPQTGPDGARQFPTPLIAFRVRYLTVGGIPAPPGQISNTHIVAFDTQLINLAGLGLNPWTTGTARVEHAVREISPPFIASNIFGSPNVARIQVAAPTGWESSFISENHELDINLQRVIVPTGAADPAEYGAAQVRNQFEVLYPAGWLSQDINFPVVFNRDQYVFVQPYMGTNSDPTQWPPYSPFVENKTRVLGPSGWQSSRFSLIGTLVENTAAPLSPRGVDATLWGPETFIAHRIRNVAPQGWDSFYTTQYAVVFNAAAVLAPQGWASAQLGTPEQVVNLNRTVKHIFPYGGETVGTAFIAYRVRTVAPSLFYDVPSGFPEVRLDPYPVAPVGIAPPQFGGHTVYEFFATVYPASTNVFPTPRVGEPIVENRNKTLRVFPSEQSLYGLAKVFNFNTNLTVTAGELTVWGAHLIGYRTRNVVVAPSSVPAISTVHRIRNVIPDPPARQLVEPLSIYIGLQSNPGIVPTPQIRTAVVYPAGFYGGSIPGPTVARNGIEIVRGIFDLAQVGTPVLITTQFVYPPPIPNVLGKPNNGDSDTFAARPVVSPHTIYAPSSDTATEQARNNHPPNTPHRIGAFTGGGDWSAGGGFPWFGLPDVALQNRSIYPVGGVLGGGSSRVGVPSATLKTQVVAPRPVFSQRFGVVGFLGVAQYVSLNSFGPLTEEFGAAEVIFAPLPPAADPFGFDAALWGTPRVELLNRAVFPTGIPHRGNPQQGLTNPWGQPLVGFPRAFVFGGQELTQWGVTWVSHGVRQVVAAGWDSCTLGVDDLDSFAQRMRVRRRNPAGSVAGIPSTATVGAHQIGHSIRAVLARGISSYNGGNHAVNTSTAIFAAGWDSLEVGDIDRWEAGVIKAHGDDLGVVGTPRMRHTLRPLGILGGEAGHPRTGVPIYAAGIPEVGFAGPSVSNPFGCTNRVVTPLPILPQQTVPQPVVTQ